MISFIGSFEIISVVRFAKSEGSNPDPKIFFWIASSVAAAAAPINPNGIKTLLANGLSTFFIKDKLVFSDGLESLPTNCRDWTWTKNTPQKISFSDQSLTKMMLW